MALHRYGHFRVEVFYFDSPCRKNNVYQVVVVSTFQFHAMMIMMVSIQLLRSKKQSVVG